MMGGLRALVLTAGYGLFSSAAASLESSTQGVDARVSQKLSGGEEPPRAPTMPGAPASMTEAEAERSLKHIERTKTACREWLTWFNDARAADLWLKLNEKKCETPFHSIAASVLEPVAAKPNYSQYLEHSVNNSSQACFSATGAENEAEDYGHSTSFSSAPSALSTRILLEEKEPRIVVKGTYPSQNCHFWRTKFSPKGLAFWAKQQPVGCDFSTMNPLTEYPAGAILPTVSGSGLPPAPLMRPEFSTTWQLVHTSGRNADNTRASDVVLVTKKVVGTAPLKTQNVIARHPSLPLSRMLQRESGGLFRRADWVAFSVDAEFRPVTHTVGRSLAFSLPADLVRELPAASDPHTHLYLEKLVMESARKEDLGLESRCVQDGSIEDFEIHGVSDPTFTTWANPSICPLNWPKEGPQSEEERGAKFEKLEAYTPRVMRTLQDATLEFRLGPGQLLNRLQSPWLLLKAPAASKGVLPCHFTPERIQLRLWLHRTNQLADVRASPPSLPLAAPNARPMLAFMPALSSLTLPALPGSESQSSDSSGLSLGSLTGSMQGQCPHGSMRNPGRDLFPVVLSTTFTSERSVASLSGSEAFEAFALGHVFDPPLSLPSAWRPNDLTPYSVFSSHPTPAMEQTAREHGQWQRMQFQLTAPVTPARAGLYETRGRSPSQNSIAEVVLPASVTGSTARAMLGDNLRLTSVLVPLRSEVVDGSAAEELTGCFELVALDAKGAAKVVETEKAFSSASLILDPSAAAAAPSRAISDAASALGDGEEERYLMLRPKDKGLKLWNAGMTRQVKLGLVYGATASGACRMPTDVQIFFEARTNYRSDLAAQQLALTLAKNSSKHWNLEAHPGQYDCENWRVPSLKGELRDWLPFQSKTCPYRLRARSLARASGNATEEAAASKIRVSLGEGRAPPPLAAATHLVATNHVSLANLFPPPIVHISDATGDTDVTEDRLSSLQELEDFAAQLSSDKDSVLKLFNEDPEAPESGLSPNLTELTEWRNEFRARIAVDSEFVLSRHTVGDLLAFALPAHLTQWLASQASLVSAAATHGSAAEAPVVTWTSSFDVSLERIEMEANADDLNTDGPCVQSRAFEKYQLLTLPSVSATPTDTPTRTHPATISPWTAAAYCPVSWPAFTSDRAGNYRAADGSLQQSNYRARLENVRGDEGEDPRLVFAADGAAPLPLESRWLFLRAPSTAALSPADATACKFTPRRIRLFLHIHAQAGPEAVAVEPQITEPELSAANVMGADTDVESVEVENADGGTGRDTDEVTETGMTDQSEIDEPQIVEQGSTATIPAPQHQRNPPAATNALVATNSAQQQQRSPPGAKDKPAATRFRKPEVQGVMERLSPFEVRRGHAARIAGFVSRQLQSTM